MSISIRPYGDSALLLEVSDPSWVLPLTDELRTWPDVRIAVPAARTVLIETERRAPDVQRALDGFRPADTRRATPRRHQLDVRYDGPDLAGIATDCGLSVDEVVRRHSAAQYTVAFCGFAPGFAYLSGLPDELRLPRLRSPRPVVPAGAVAIADEYSAIYPASSPGGWLLLGTCAATLFDPSSEPPALLAPGDRVRFICR